MLHGFYLLIRAQHIGYNRISLWSGHGEIIEANSLLGFQNIDFVNFCYQTGEFNPPHRMHQVELKTL